jgi:hypothetical protein
MSFSFLFLLSEGKNIGRMTTYVVCVRDDVRRKKGGSHKI